MTSNVFLGKSIKSFKIFEFLSYSFLIIFIIRIEYFLYKINIEINILL